MKILLIAPRYLPIFNKNDEGAIEKLEQIYLKYNEITSDEFTIYSPKIANDNYDHRVLRNSLFRVIDQTSFRYKVGKMIGAVKRRIIGSSNNENYIRTIVKDIIKRGEQNKYDLILFENGEQDIPVFKKLTNTKTRIVLHLHNDYVNTETKGSSEIIKACDEIWTVSSYLKTRVLKVGPIKTIVIPNTIQEQEVLDNELCKKILKRIKKKNNEKVFLYVGRLLESKGILDLLEAFNCYLKKRPNDILLVVGKTNNDKSGKKTKRRIESLSKNNERIHLIGYVKPEEVINYQAVSDCQIVPSKCNEAFGLVILEAMVTGLPIIATRIGGIPEIGGNMIEYVNPDSLVGDLVFRMAQIRKGQRIDYSHILEKYSTIKFEKKIYDAIHKEEK